MLPPHFMARVKDFWLLVKKVEPEKCWRWLGPKYKTRPYGQFTCAGFTSTPPQFSLCLKLGRRLNPGVLVCHTCDNYACVNPEHLYEGTAQTNGFDRVKRRKKELKTITWALPNKSKNKIATGAKLTEDDVRTLRKKYQTGKFSLKVLAEEYGLNLNTIFKAVNRISWQQVA